MFGQLMRGCRPLSDDEVGRTLASFAGRYAARNRALFLLGLKTGFRISELLSLRLRDVLAGDGRSPNTVSLLGGPSIVDRITVRRGDMKKKLQSRTIILHPGAKAALGHWIDELQAAGQANLPGPLFPSRKGADRPISAVQAWRVLQVAFAAAGVHGQTGTHCMRKTFAKKVHDALGGDIMKTQQALGHRDVKCTLKYLSFREEEIDRAILAS